MSKHKLTARQRKIIELMEKDYTIAEIAYSLNVSKSTITSILAKLRNKLGYQTNYGMLFGLQ